MPNYGYGLLANASVAPTYVITPITANLCIATPNPTFGLNLPPFSGTPASVLNSIFSQLATNSRAGWIHCRAGDYNLGSANPAVTIRTPFTLTGEGFSSNPTPIAAHGTRFLAGVNGQTLFQATSTGFIIQEWGMENFACIANGFTGINGIDMSAGTETSSAGSFIRNVYFDALSNGSFATEINLDHQEDTLLFQVGSRSGGAGNDSATVACVHWDISGGNAMLLNCFFLDRGVPSLITHGQQIVIRGGTMGPIQYDANAPVTGGGTLLDSVYIALSGTAGARIQLNGFTQNAIYLRNCLIYIDSVTPTSFISGAGTVTNLIYSGNIVSAATITANWRVSAPTITNSVSLGDNLAQGNVPGGTPPYAALGKW